MLKPAITLIAGGTGSAKLLRGFGNQVRKDLNVIVNVGDNFTFYGLRVCPDVDIAMYALAKIQNTRRGWGIHADKFDFMDQLARYGEEAWFRLGDRDLAATVLRTLWLNSGMSLTQVTQRFCNALGIRHRLLPACDDALETWVQTDRGDVHLQEFWVGRGGNDRVLGISYHGLEDANPGEGVLDALSTSRAIIICPANPVSSIGPILAVRETRMALQESKAVRIAVSPIIGAAPISGPAAAFMKASGQEISVLGVARAYQDFLDYLVIDTSDKNKVDDIRELGITPLVRNIKMNTSADEAAMAFYLLRQIRSR